MNKLSRIVLGLAMGATALTSFAGGSFANQHEVTLSYGETSIDVGRPGDFRGNDVTLESRGTYDSGFRYDVSLTKSQMKNVVIPGAVNQALGDANFGELNFRYMPTGLGLAGSFEFGDNIEDNLGLGVAAEYDVFRLEAYGALTSDVENFLDDFDLEIGARYELSEAAILMTELNRSWNNDENAQTSIEVGGRYYVTQNSYVQATYETSVDSSDLDAETFSLGVGLNF